MGMKIIIDNREPTELIEYIKKLVETSTQFNNIYLEVTTLEIGDVWIYKDLNTNPTKPDIILERKSLSDLLASVKDGRYKEQSFRLDKFPLPNHNIYYIIEGNIERISNQTSRQIIYSCLFTLSYFKGFSTINTQTIKQTGEIIFRFSDKLLRENKKKSYYDEDQEKDKSSELKEADEEKEEHEKVQYSSVIKASKKSNITQDNILEIMLMQIPSVSANVAQLIGANFKSMKELINSLEKDKNCLNGLLINGKRKIAKPTIQNIITYVLQDKFEIVVAT